MIKCKITNTIKMPQLSLHQQLKPIADKIVIPLLRDNIEANWDIYGKCHPALEASTIKKKGHSHPLIDTGLLKDSFKSYQSRRDEVQVRVKSGRRKIAEYLQIKGVGRKKKKFEFFGVTQGMERDALRFMSKAIARMIRNAQ